MMLRDENHCHARRRHGTPAPQRDARTRNVGFKTALNDAVRHGLREHVARTEPPFKIMAKAMHLLPGIDPSRMHDLEAAVEVEAFKVLTARLARERGVR